MAKLLSALSPTPPFLMEPQRVRVFCWLIAPLLCELFLPSSGAQLNSVSSDLHLCL